jgi:intracellular multiplication protein IcmL
MLSRNNILVANVLFVWIFFAATALLLAYQIYKPKPYFYAKSYTGTLTPLTAHYTPNVSPKALLNWASLAATAAYSMDYVGYQKSLENLAPFFTKIGFNNFITAITDANVINDLTAKKLMISAVPIGVPTIVNEGIVFGEYTWIIQLPIAIKYQTASEESTQLKAVSLTVSRVSPDIAPRGIGIKSFQDAPLNR